MAEISLFVDESGESGAESKYYLLTIVFHDQDAALDNQIALYEGSLRRKGLPNIPLHTSPLLNGHDDYKGMDIQQRKQLLQCFFTMLQHMPIKYHTFAYRKGEFKDGADLVVRMKRDVVNLVFDNLEYLQRFEKVKVYYDDGQQVVTKSLHDAIGYALASGAVMYRDGSPRDYRLAQAADMICALELTALKYEAKEQTKTDDRFFGAYGSFKKNYLKKIRKMMI